jgi:hypothetical protein
LVAPTDTVHWQALSKDFIDLRVIDEANDLTAGKAAACGS